MKKPTTPIYRCEISTECAASLVAALEWTADHVWLSQTKCCDRATVRGVPAKRFDVIVDQRIRTWTVDPRDAIVAEVVEKSGRFDGAVRPRLALTVVQGRHNRRDPAPFGRLTIAESGERTDITTETGGPPGDGLDHSPGSGRT